MDKCIVHGCENRKGEGTFVGELCSPCHTMLTTGRIGPGSTFIHKIAWQRDTLLRLIAKLSNDFFAATKESIATMKEP